MATLRTGRLIRTTGLAEEGEIETYHDRIREVVDAKLAGETRRSHHLRLASTLEASSRSEPDFLAEHFQRGGDHEKACRYYLEAAARASKTLAFDRAVAQYRIALELSRSDPESTEIRIKLADALVDVGHGAEAARHYIRAAEAAPSPEKLELQRKGAMHLLMSGNIDEGTGILKGVLDRVGMTLPSTPMAGPLRSLLFWRLRIRLRGLAFRVREVRDVDPAVLTRLDVCWSAASGFGLVNYARGGFFYARHLLLALQTGEPRRVARALASEAGYISAAGTSSTRHTGRLLVAAESIPLPSDDIYSIAILEMNRGYVEYLSGRWKLAHEALDRTETLLRKLPSGATWELDTTQTFSLWSLIYLGSIADLRRRHAELIRLAENRGNLFAMMNLNTYILATIKTGDGEPEVARQELQAISGRWSQQGFHVQHHNEALARVNIELYEGNGRIALDFLEEKWPAYKKSLLLHVQQVRIDVIQLRARAALATAMNAVDPRPLLRSAERDAGRLERERAGWADALARLFRAAISQGRGDTVGARRRLQEAVTMLEGVNMRLFAQAARRRLGGLIGGEQGAAMVVEADSWMTNQGIRNPARMTASFAPGFPE